MVLTSNTVLLTFILSIYIRLQTCWMLLIICVANCWPKDQGQYFFYNRIRALEKCNWPSAFQLQRNMLKSGKIKSEYLLP